MVGKLNLIIMKLSWFISSLVLFMILISYSDFYFTFKAAILFTFLAELAIFYLNHKFQPFNLDAEPFEEIELEDSPEHVMTSSKFHFHNNPRRKTTIPCLCNLPNFQVLCSGSEQIMSELYKNLKALIDNDKNCWTLTEKLSEISVLDRIQHKNNYIVDLLKILTHMSKFNQSEMKELEDSMLFAVKLMEKDVRKSQKHLSEKLKKAGEVYSQELTNMKKFMEKVEKHKRDLATCKVTLEQSTGKPERFDKNLELESKIRIISNKISKNSHRIEISKDNLLKESTSYLETTNKLYSDLLEVNQLKGESHRSNIQCYLTTVHNIWKQSHSELVALAETNNSFSESSRTIEDEGEKTLRKPASLLPELKEHFVKLDSLIERFASIEKEHMQKFVYVFENWDISPDIGIASGYFDFTHAVGMLNDNLQEFQKECEFIKQSLAGYLKSFSFEASEENLLTQSSNFFDTKKLFLSILLSNYSEKVKIVAAAAKYFDTNEEIKEMLSFSKLSDRHANRCPFFTDGIQIDFDLKAQQKNTENAQWINSLLEVYIEEWKTSPKFQEYICKKLSKKLNKDNPNFVGNIAVRDFSYSGPAPNIRDFLCKSDSQFEFNYEVSVSTMGNIQFIVKVPLNFGVLSFEIEAIIRIVEFNGKIRICYTAEGDEQSWYSLAGSPSLNLLVYPRVGNTWLDVSSIPAVKWIVDKLIMLKLRVYAYPKKRSIKIPKARPKRQQYP